MIRDYKDYYRLGRRFLRQMIGRDLPYRRQVRCEPEWLGSVYGGWSVCPRGLGPQSIVYSCGVGHDISFDLAFIQRFGGTVYGFDPTPAVSQWLQTQTLPPQFKFHNYGVAAFDGNLSFTPHVDPTWDGVSLVDPSLIGNAPADPRAIQAPVKRLATIMQTLGHSHVDVLKIDIEGSEYTVIEDLVQSGVKVSQVLIEFHHFLDTIGIDKTRTAIETLLKGGYRIFDITPTGFEYSFIQADALR